MIDFGFLDELSVSQLRPLQEESFQEPSFSVRCNLADIQPAGDITKWSATACEYLTELIKDTPICYVKQKVNIKLNYPSRMKKFKIHILNII